MSVEQLITQHINTWTSALQTRSTAGRGNNGKIDLYGIKKLRELILELAVRGKLVPQDPNDEPASELLKRIAAEKAELVKQGKIKKQKPLPEISEDEKPFELPEGWEWVRFGNIYEMEYGNNLPQEKRTNTGEYNVYGSNGVVGTHNVACVNSPCIVIGRKGSAGALNLSLNIGCWVTDVAYSSIPPKAMNLDFVFMQFHTLGLASLGKGIKPGLNRNDAYGLSIAIPPQNEQENIVLKVKELMALCDQLEQQSLTSQEAHSQLVNTLLATLTNSQNAEELAENWMRISQHFDTLFTTEASIDALKQTILQLAVMGKLVPQDPSDEPASELLKRIEQEKAQLVKEGKIKKQKPLQPVSDEERPFDLPEGWEWVRFGSVINIRAELVKPENHYNSLQVAPDIIEKGTGKVLSKRTVKESGVKGPNSKFYKNQIVYSKIRPSLSKAFIAEYDGLCSADMYPIDCFINSEYLLKVILSEVFLIQVRAAENRIKMPKLNVDSLSNILIPVPPAKVQSVISDRINEMHISSDLLKTRLQSAQQTQLHLADALTDAALS
ncbi:Restriction endonuclease S subunit [Pantoea agglomerans]|uniref:restriction endonuclease subunit S n=1 Tax=Enterobacter agglomerans TaxID=549 RepID=UPI00044B488E|nr:restriction endonuclease subunit S [Pantoea agglomerans]EZI31371.1 Restriction endonuclease S subunit [Pantoea agglomerans]EZI36098.1 Restriction endonuclease S subunit [Pantoea agglomerans]